MKNDKSCAGYRDRIWESVRPSLLWRKNIDIMLNQDFMHIEFEEMGEKIREIVLSPPGESGVG
jgi:hypothetical protein